MTLLATVVVLTLLISATCSLLEATLYSTRVASLEAAVAQGRHARGAAHFLGMKRRISQPTSAILILNTVANTGGAAMIGMLGARHLGPSSVPLLSVLLTLAILLVAEILPKTVGATHWRGLWPVLVWPLAFLQRALAPLIWVTEHFASMVTRGGRSPVTTEEEILAMIQMGAKGGEVTATELELLTAVFQFDQLAVQQIMTPRHETVVLDVNWSFERSLEVARQTRHTRYPLCAGSLDESIGLIHVKDLLGLSPDSDVQLSTLARPLERVPGSMLVSRLMRHLQRSRQHFVLVVDEFGTVVGSVSLENILEQIVGAVQDEFDTEVPDLELIEPGVYEAHGRTTLGWVGQQLDLRLEEPAVFTLSGLIVLRLGRLPRAGDQVELGGLRAEVLEVRRHRATRVRLVVHDREDEVAESGSESGGEGAAPDPD